MDNFTHKDIEALREYLDKLEELNKKEPPKTLTVEEWEEALAEIKKTGKIPAKYEGRIAENEILTNTEIVDGHIRFTEEARPTKTYYDIAKAKRDAEYGKLNGEYFNYIKKALLFSKDSKEGNISKIIQSLLEDPEIQSELEKEQTARLAPIGSVPNGESLNWLYRVVNSSKGGRHVKQGKGNRHEKITTQTKKNEDGSTVARFIRENKQTGNIAIVEIDQADTYLSKTSKTFTKVLLFTLQKMTAQNFPLKVGFSLQELVDLGMYSNTSNAARAVKEFFNQQTRTKLKGVVKKGKNTVKEEGGILFYHYELENGYMTLSVNGNFNMEFIANYFTVFPRFAYSLSNNAFSLVRYIFFLARQNSQAIKDKGTFTIKMDAVRENLGLPTPEEVKNRKYKQYIINPIEKAIEEIEIALQTVPEAKEYGFTITPHGTDTKNINEWLNGYLEIGLKGDFAETFIKIATKAEADRKHWKKIKQAELAKISAKEEAKKEKEKEK